MYLFDLLKRKLSIHDDENKHLLDSINCIIHETDEQLKNANLYFPHFSKHDSSHSRTIEKEIINLLGEERLVQLSCSDLLMMLFSFHLHDIGMALEYESIYNKYRSCEVQDYINKNAKDKKSPIFFACNRLLSIDSGRMKLEYEYSIDVYNDVILVIEDYFRKEHAKRSSDYIQNNETILKTIGIRCCKVLAVICDTHQKPVCEIMNLKYKCNGLFDDYIHPRFIASMLCLGDLLDLDTDRFDKHTINSVTPFPKLSKIHLKKHESVTHFLVENNGIEVCSDTDDIEVHREMRQWMDWMKDICGFMALNWESIAPKNFGNAPTIRKCELLINGNSKWISFSNLKYTISDRRMFELMKGANIYRNKFICLREIIQNAVDATILRLYDEKIIKTTEISDFKNFSEIDRYNVHGNISLTNNNTIKVEVRDYGIGISNDDIRRMANIDNTISERKQRIIKRMPMYIRPSGAFGMGIQSIFLISKEFEIVTKTSNELAKRVIFHSSTESDGYIIVEDYNDSFEQGTKISFIIDNDLLTQEDIHCATYYYRRNDIARTIADLLYSKYQNQEDSFAPISRMIKEEYEYVPVRITISKPRLWDNKDMIVYKPIFSNFKDTTKIKDSICDTVFLNTDYNCIFYSRIGLKKQDQYGSLSDSIEYSGKYGNVVFYRNRYVSNTVLEKHYYNNTPLFPYLDWKINILDSTSDEVLELNRNNLKESYLVHFYNMILDCFKKSIKSIIDKILDENITYDIGDVIILLLQFANEYSYRTEDIIKKYKEKLKVIHIDNYYVYGTDNPKIFDALSLYQKQLYFVIKDYGEIELSGLKVAEEKELYDLNKSNKVHILNHKINSIAMYSKNGHLLKIAQCSPYNCIKSNNESMSFDENVILEQTVRMIMFNHRGIPSFHEYEQLGTPITDYYSSFSHNTFNASKIIELPFEEYLPEMKKAICSSYYIKDAIKIYYDRIIKSNIYISNIDYIAEINKSKKEDIEMSYQKLIAEILKLLEKKQELIKIFVSQFKEESNKSLFGESRQSEEYNNYIAYYYSPKT